MTAMAPISINGTDITGIVAEMHIGIGGSVEIILRPGIHVEWSAESYPYSPPPTRYQNEVYQNEVNRSVIREAFDVPRSMLEPADPPPAPGRFVNFFAGGQSGDVPRQSTLTHTFAQDPAEEPARLCVECGMWPDHHSHTEGSGCVCQECMPEADDLPDDQHYVYGDSERHPVNWADEHLVSGADDWLTPPRTRWRAM
jgi:hypothetical protein